jgi:hypothetical protein
VGGYHKQGESSRVPQTRQRNATTVSMFLVLYTFRWKSTHSILVWVHEDPESVFSTLVKNADEIVHVFVIVFSTEGKQRLSKKEVGEWG